MISSENLVTLVNDGYVKKCKFKLKKYQEFSFYIYSEEILTEILKVLKFKDKGNMYDYKLFKSFDEINMNSHADKYDQLNRIAISNKYNAIMYYKSSNYSIACKFLVKISSVKAFMKATAEILKNDTSANIFKDVDFKCGKGKYIELCDPAKDDETKTVDIIKKTMRDEKLVFDSKSTITTVMKDINSFFTTDTKKLYEKLNIPHKRGIILHGDPGNGKSAMIRQIIRKSPDIAKIIINPNISNLTKVLSALTNALNGQDAMIIIEDIDSVIDDYNRSEFLNILDGVDIKSGLYFIGTTNYPERVDPAIMNRSGRFDRTHKINNPTEETRRLYFESREVGSLFGNDYQIYDSGDKKIKDRNKEIVELFVENSYDMPMASLKEIITTVANKLVTKEEKYIEDAIVGAYNELNSTRIGHINEHNSYGRSSRKKKRGFGGAARRQPSYDIGDVLEETEVEVKEFKPAMKKSDKKKMNKAAGAVGDDEGYSIIPKREWGN